MGLDSSLTTLQGGLVVSCQAPATSPLHEPRVIAAMAAASVSQGAVGVRIDSPEHVEAVRQRVSVPIIGLWKQVYQDSEVYITPQFHHAQAIAAAGADIIAIDATLRPRPGGETLTGLIQRIHAELQKPVMADIDTLASAEAAVKAGTDLLGTTLYGYTQETQSVKPPGFDLLSTIVTQFQTPCICEGGIASPEAARKALDGGAYAVVVGTAITGIDILAQRYCNAVSPSDRSKYRG
ncbi:N-acetylmannosamine-6-phosphate 2-epimerase [Oscillatoria sp. CS-180]|uniref:N-acetylmannosamine-6-phosphate 2-epimerase n=1 Tax=Oscillatoria sp. CS-180 TaxID=3021720 RepID=UPI00232FFF11|nr:N-acetylmannosamine-6-phosphate 2-epimerase [Oscillatoria sp. CS-180]MDB9528018.1 N-acetylmannosamine-6-phosphate 2-epimerase [Oscillatoria sp. CS-180]